MIPCLNAVLLDITSAITYPVSPEVPNLTNHELVILFGFHRNVNLVCVNDKFEEELVEVSFDIDTLLLLQKLLCRMNEDKI